MKHLQVFKQWCLLLAAAQSRTSLSKGRKTPLHQKTKHTKTKTTPLCSLCSCFTSVTASLCGQGCKRVKKHFVFSATETRPCCYPVSEHNAAKQSGSLNIPPFRAETELDLLWNSYIVFTSKATWSVTALALRPLAACRGICKQHCVQKVNQQCPGFCISLKLPINWCLFKSMAWEHASANAEMVGLDASISPDPARNNIPCPASVPCSHWSDVTAFSTTGQGQSVPNWQSKRSLFKLCCHSEGTPVPTCHWHQQVGVNRLSKTVTF